MKTSYELINEKITVNNGHFKGAKITVSKEMMIQLMEDYHKQYYVSDEEIEQWAYNKCHEVEDARWFTPFIIGAKWMRDLIFKK